MCVLQLTRDEFNATHRPEIIVHSITAPMDVSVRAMDDHRIGAFVLFFNKGVTEAKITKITAMISRQFVPIQSGLFAEGDVEVRHPDLAAGMKNYFSLKSTYSQDQERKTQVSPPDSRLSAIFCKGVIAYEDGRGVKRETAFCHRYDAVTERWASAGEPEYEYAY